MSRIANSPVVVPSDVTVTLSGNDLTMKSSKGQLTLPVHESVSVVFEDNELRFSARGGMDNAVALSGTMRALAQNMVKGLVDGIEIKLLLIGVGYRAKMEGNRLNLTLGYSHPCYVDAPEGITFSTPSQTEVVVSGIDKQKVGQVAAEIRALRPPRPYNKGKGVRLEGEEVVQKVVKKTA